MDARVKYLTVLLAAFCSLGASHRTKHFIVSAPTAAFAREVADAAEAYRRDLAIEWLGKELPPWRDVCPIRVEVGPHLGAGGMTSFSFQSDGMPFGWTMSIQGSRERILDSVLPHEITHTVFATHFGRPLPRWADEGACTTVEHSSEKRKQSQLLIQFLTTDRGIAFNRMFAMKEYPRDILPLYAQGYSVARFLIAQGGKRKFIKYVGDGMQSNNWSAATARHYGMRDLSELQVTWLDWVRRGSPPITPKPNMQFASQSNSSPTNTLASGNTPPPVTQAQIVRPANQSRPATTGSWYARQRDKAFAARGQVVSAPQPSPSQPSSVVRGQSLAREQGGPITIQATRPQPLGRPGQTPVGRVPGRLEYGPGSVQRLQGMSYGGARAPQTILR